MFITLENGYFNNVDISLKISKFMSSTFFCCYARAIAMRASAKWLPVGGYK